MASIEDIMLFLQGEKEARARERQEDLESIKLMVIDGVKKEVKVALEPFKERLEAQEKATQDLRLQLNRVIDEVETLKDRSKISDFQFPPLTKATSSLLSTNFGLSAKSNSDISESDQADKTQQLCSKARRIVGFKPIEPRMLRIQMDSYGARDLEEAKLMEIKSYLKCEMKMPPSEISKLDIFKIFSPPGQLDEFDTLFVEFGSEFQVDKIFNYTRNIVKSDHRIVHWFPFEMKERRYAVEKIAFELREVGRTLKTRTRVKVGRNDIELWSKTPGGKWKKFTLPSDLPVIDLNFVQTAAQSSSPPPGRPRISIERSNKQLGPDVIVEEVSKMIRDENVSEVTEPLSETQSIPDLSAVVKSPILNSKSFKCY